MAVEYVCVHLKHSVRLLLHLVYLCSSMLDDAIDTRTYDTSDTMVVPLRSQAGCRLQIVPNTVRCFPGVPF